MANWTANIPLQNACKRDLKTGSIAPASLETLAVDSSSWRANTRLAIKITEQKKKQKWARRHKIAEAAPSDVSVFTDNSCNSICCSRIGFYSLSLRCNSTTD
ncbi:hypothetical protein ElyMa_006891800 [Elysia marginata]|uniref:Uncharacterized protein n=1 Tax=Elysia marginata TaxID=1093978 RepID=A0AAV4JHT4_9GAST|nr:hypothetical protein ElyMa_006891800 [Elysia marginata]